MGPHGLQGPRPLADPAEIIELAMLENGSWVAQHLEYGYRYGPLGSGRRHPEIVDWDQLGDVEMKKDIENVRAINDLIKSLGFSLTEGS